MSRKSKHTAKQFVECNVGRGDPGVHEVLARRGFGSGEELQLKSPKGDVFWLYAAHTYRSKDSVRKTADAMAELRAANQRIGLSR